MKVVGPQSNRAKTAAGVAKTAQDLGFQRTYNLKPEYLYSVVRAISARVNQNFDGFPSGELKKAYATFRGKPVFVNHHNDDHRRTRGMIVDSAYHEDGNDKYVKLLIEIDARNFPRLASKIASGELDSVSMGTDVEFTRCSYCNNVAYEIDDFCSHVRNSKGKRLARKNPDGSIDRVLVYESCHGLNFFEISYVFDPADETAIGQRVLLPRKAASMQKRALGELTAPGVVDTLRQDVPCPQCGDPTFNGDTCEVCQYVRPPEEYQDPDTMKSRVLQIVRNSPDKTGRRKGNVGDTNNARLKVALARKRLAEAQRRLADDDGAGMTTDQARQPDDTTNVQDLNSNPVTTEEAKAPDANVDVQDLSSTVTANLDRYKASKRRQAGPLDDPTQGGAPTDPQASEPANSDGPNSGPPTSDGGDETGISDLPIDWKQDQSGQPYGTVQGTDLDIFVNEDMSWQVLPEGSNDPIAQGQGGSYEDCVKQAFQAATQIASQVASDPSAAGAGDPTAAAPVAAGDPAAAAQAGPPPHDPTKKASQRKRADDASSVAAPDQRTDVEKLPDYDTLTDGGNTFDSGDYAHNAGDDIANPVDGSDVQNFAPGGEPFTSDNRTAGAIKAGELVEAEIAVGLFAPKSRAAKFARVAAYENAPSVIVNDRITLLSAVERVLAQRESSRPRGLVPQRVAAAQSPRVPNLGQRSTSRSVLSSVEQADDYLMTI